MNKTQKGFAVIESALILLVVGALVGIGVYIQNSKTTTNKSYENSVKASDGSLPKPLNIKSFDECVKAAGSIIEQTSPETCLTSNNKKFTQVASSTPPAPVQQSTVSENVAVSDNAPIINFVDTSGWTTITSPDGSYQVQLNPGYTYGYCKDDQSIVLLGMVFLDTANNKYPCSSVDQAVTMRDPYYLTRIGFGSSSTAPSIPASAQSFNYKMADGRDVTRYSYTETAGSTSYSNTEYVAIKDGTYYFARYRVETNINYSNEVAFDTVALKTWEIL